MYVHMIHTRSNTWMTCLKQAHMWEAVSSSIRATPTTRGAKKKKKRHRRLGAWTTRSGRASSTEYYFVFIFNSYSYEYIVVLVIVSEDSIIRYISYPTCLALLPLLPSTSPWMLRRYRRESLNLIKYRNSLHYFGLFYRCCIYTNMDQTRFSFETRHYSIPVYTKHKKTYPIRMKLPTA